VIACFAVALALAAGSAEDVEAAKRYFDAGRAAYEQSRYDAAVAAFEAAYELAPRPGLAFSLAQAHRLQFFDDRDPAKLERAVELYRTYLDEAPSGRRREDAVDHLSTLEPILLRLQQELRLESLREARRDRTQLMVSTEISGAQAAVDGGELREAPLVTRVAPGPHRVRIEAAGFAPKEVQIEAVEGRLVMVDGDLDPLPARLAVETSGGAEVAVGGRVVGRTPLDAPLELDAGRYLVTLRKTGARPVARELELARGEAQTLRVELQPTAQRKAAWVVAGLSGGLLVAGGITTGLAFAADAEASELADRLESGPPLSPDEGDDLARLTAERDDLRLASGILLGSAVATGLTSVLLFVLDRPRPEGPAGPVELVPGVGGATVRARF
jgi:tetratricopeptide (TPR) repeat protein